MKKIIGIFICMLLITIAMFPITNAFNINKSLKKVNTELVTSDRPEVWVSIPDVHIHSKRPLFNWGTVEFDNPGTVIDVDLSGVEGDEFLLGISQNVICHFENHFLPLLVIYTLKDKSMSTQPYYGDYIQKTAWLLLDKTDSFYPIDVWVTGVPFMFIGYLSYYWLLHMRNDDLSMNPSEFEVKFGTTAHYELNLII